MKRIYCISGLGADQRLFKKLSIPGFELVPLPWVLFDKDDDMASYSIKIYSCIPEKEPIILGLSFGGMLAVEISKLHPQCKVIIISSAKRFSELKIHGGAISRLLVSSMIIPAKFFKVASRITLYYLGADTPEEKQLLRQVIRDSDGRFMRWALKAVATWKNVSCPDSVIHIHGTADKTIPSALVHPDYWIEGGSHIMIYNRAEEVSTIIHHCLTK